MERKAIFKVMGQKAVMVNIHPEMNVIDDIRQIVPEYPGVFGKADEQGTFANLVITGTLDKSASTVKLRCKDSAKIALDLDLPWNQVKAELEKIEGPAEIEIIIAGVVGSI